MYDQQSPFSVTKLHGRRDSLSDSAYATLRAAIVDCQISPGRAVSEAELNARFAFGLAAVRAAVMRLTASGWIAPDGRRGSVILPVSAAHLADLTVSRQCLEPALLHHVPPSDLGTELRLRAAVHHATSAPGTGPNRQTLHYQERALMVLIAQAVAAPRIRGWLIDTWELCLRADRHLEQCFGISRETLPLPGLAVAVADGDAPATTALLEQMRHAFDLRVSRALARSATPLSVAPEPPQLPRRGTAHTTDPRLETAPKPRSTKGDPA